VKPSFDFILEVLRLYFGKIQNKASILLILGGIEALTGGLQLLVASVIAAVIDKPISQPQTATWVGFALIALGMVFPAVEVWRDWNKKPEKPHPNDVALLGQFRALMTINLLRQLREHSFGQSFARAVLDPLDDLEADWKDATHEFVDADLQAQLVKVRDANEALLDVTMVRLFVHRQNPALCTASTDMDLARGISKDTLDGIKTMNGLARDLYREIQALERLGARHIDRYTGP
jgi:hypothetical protein